MKRAAPEKIVAAGLTELCGELAIGLGRPPTLAEIGEVLSWALDRGAGGLRFVATPTRRAPPSCVAELNDAAFVAAADLMAALARATRTSLDDAPALEALLDVVAAELDRRAAELLTAPPKRIRGVKVAPTPKRATPGDLVSVPAKKGRRHLVLVVAKNRFGTAFAPLEVRAGARIAAKLADGALEGRPIYSGEESIRSGRWRIVAHQDQMLARFDDAPEIFHRPDPESPDDAIGKYGAGETPDGRLRRLTRREAQALGLLDGRYRQVLSPEQLEAHLDAR